MMVLKGDNNHNYNLSDTTVLIKITQIFIQQKNGGIVN